MKSGPDLALGVRISLDDLTGNLEVFRAVRCLRDDRRGKYQLACSTSRRSGAAHRTPSLDL